MKSTVEGILVDVLKMMNSFKRTIDEDSPAYSFFEARLNEDGFFILREEIMDYLSMLEEKQPVDIEQRTADNPRKEGKMNNTKIDVQSERIKALRDGIESVIGKNCHCRMCAKLREVLCHDDILEKRETDEA